ncbi:MAG: TetR/AcrR family transcriptional regulator [Acidimicrobiales bacterium]|nr:TetR/AcrR family transcriptional regulator [Acidimicrobiales bacterium]MCB9395986.1 TetR/AcrR family transcriptional regulator [Acidimicrobiaceae bacterium]
MTGTPSPPVGLRRTPQQARSRARVDAVIAALLELVGEVERASDLTTADVAARAGVPLGSLYEYFEDLPSVVDAAMSRVLERHDELLLDLRTDPPRNLRQLVDALFDTYLQLYREQPGFLALRNSTLFQRHHRDWLTRRVSSFVADIAEQATALGIFATRPDTFERLDFVFAMGDAVLQTALRDGGSGDPMILDEGRAIIQYATRRVMNGLDAG